MKLLTSTDRDYYSYADGVRDVLASAMKTEKRNYTVYFDCKNDGFIIGIDTNGTKPDNLIKLGVVRVGNLGKYADKADNKEYYSQKRQAFVDLRKEYISNSCTCLSQARKEYGKANVIDEAWVGEAQNPHYHCAAPMQFYDRNIIEYYIRSKSKAK